MLNKEDLLGVLQEWNVWKQDPSRFCGIERELTAEIIKYVDVPEVLVLFGVRRCGKSTIMYQLMKRLMERGVAREQFLCVNFEERAFINELSVELIDRVYELYLEKINPGRKTYLFLDEVQKIPGWETWVRSIYDKKKDVKIVISGSSSGLLSREFGSALTGRYLSFRVLPLCFREFVGFQGPRPASSHERKARFSEFLEWGGFPEVVLREKDYRKRLLNDYFDGIISRDIEERHEIRDSTALKRICIFLLTNVSKSVSYNSIKNTFGISLDTAKEYVSYMEEAFLVFEHLYFSYSLKEQMARQRKIYCIDNGLRNANSVLFSRDIGRLVENAVFLELMHKGREVFYWRNGNEVDFIVRNGKDILPINVSYGEDINKREVAGLLSFMKEHRVKEGLVLTEDSHEEKSYPEGKIRFVPVWLWLLGEG
jgi:hypothetical protein